MWEQLYWLSLVNVTPVWLVREQLYRLSLVYVIDSHVTSEDQAYKYTGNDIQPNRERPEVENPLWRAPIWRWNWKGILASCVSVRERTLYCIFLFILSQWRDLTSLQSIISWAGFSPRQAVTIWHICYGQPVTIRPICYCKLYIVSWNVIMRYNTSKYMIIAIKLFVYVKGSLQHKTSSGEC